MKTILFTSLLAFSQFYYCQTPVTVLETTSENEEEVFDFPEVEAQFKHGTKDLQNFIAKNIRYPQEAIELNIVGKVYLAFVIDTKGRVNDIVVEKSGGPYLDEEAVRVIGSMPKWKPGKMKNKKVKTRVRLPINFTLN